MARRRLILVLLATAWLISLIHAQVKPQATQAKTPQLKLEVIPTKNVYTVGEIVFVKYKLTSLVDGTLCFASPAVNFTGAFGGSLRSDVIPPIQAKDWNLFIEHFWPTHLTAEQLTRQKRRPELQFCPQRASGF